STPLFPRDMNRISHACARVNVPAAAAGGAAVALYACAEYPVAVAGSVTVLAASTMTFLPAASGSRASALWAVTLAALTAGLLLGAGVRLATVVEEERRFLPVAPEEIRRVHGTVQGQTGRSSSGWTARLEVDRVDTSGGSYASRFHLSVFGLEARPPADGGRLLVKGRLSEGEHGSYMRAVSAERGVAPHGIRHLRRLLSGRVESALSQLDAQAGLARALLLGRRDGVSAESERLFRRSGTSHLLALSGMHLGVLIAPVGLVLSPIAGRRAAAAVSLVVVVCYVFLIGFRASLVRAAVMLAFFVVAVILDRRGEPMRILASAFLLLVLFAPGAVDGLSFQLSFAALAGILILGRGLDAFLLPWLPAAVRTPLAAAIGAQFATMPIIAATFGVVRPVGVGATLVMAPIVVLFLWGSAAAVSAAMLGASASVYHLGEILWYLERALLGTAEVFATAPGVRIAEAHQGSLGLVCVVLAGLLVLSQLSGWAPAVRRRGRSTGEADGYSHDPRDPRIAANTGDPDDVSVVLGRGRTQR
ncbi:MAG: ComEC/Rec2 family competence protein, partial [Spirochaetaceae bacterium]